METIVQPTVQVDSSYAINIVLKTQEIQCKTVPPVWLNKKKNPKPLTLKRTTSQKPAQQWRMQNEDSYKETFCH